MQYKEFSGGQRMKYDISVKWTGSYPTLCCGEWVIIINGVTLANLDNDNFGTYDDYQQWRFVDWNEEFYSIESGVSQLEWIDHVKKTNLNNLITALQNAGFEITDELLGQLYVEINSCDWIHGSCGGCI